MNEFLTVEIGRTKIAVQDLKNLESGSVIVLENNAGALFNIFVKGHLFAKGVIVIIEENFAVKILEIVNNSFDDRHEDETYGNNPDLPFNIIVEAARIQISVQEIKDFREGSIIELKKAAAMPADVFANGNLIAKGTVVVIDEKFAVKITEMISN